MTTKLKMLAGPGLIAAGFLIGCSSPTITDRTDPARPSSVQTSEGYDTFGRKWATTNQPVAAAPKPKALSRHEAMLMSYTGTITDIDYPNREMTLKGSEGHLETVYVDKDVKRFSEAKVGDKVTLDYYLGVNAEIRKPTPEEELNPLVVTESAGKAGAGEAPFAHGMRQVRAVVTIERLNRDAETITVKGPRGKYFTAQVADPSRFDKVRIGDTILMTFTEAAAISLKPAAN